MSAALGRAAEESDCAVERTLRFFRDRGLWHLTSENPPVRSCAEAAAHRRRLGQVGIPLCDELKSLLYAYEDASGLRRYVLLHCRGHQRVDLGKVAATLATTVMPVEAAELLVRFGAEYGTVTPPLLGAREGVRHLVDDTVLARYYPPHTIMTNCGDLEHAVEFRAAALFESMPDVAVVDIVLDEDKQLPRQQLGFVTGNPPESGILLWQRVNDRIRSDDRVRLRGDVGLPRVVIESVPDLGASLDLPEREAFLRHGVLRAVEGLCEAGLTAIAVTCALPLSLSEEVSLLCTRHGARFYPLAVVTADYLRRERVVTFDLLGSGSVGDISGQSAFGPALRGLDVHVPTPRSLAVLRDLAYLVKQELVSPAAVNRFRDLVSRSTKTDTVVLALPELSILMSGQKGHTRSGKRFIDTFELLADALAEVYLQERLATGAG